MFIRSRIYWQFVILLCLDSDRTCFVLYACQSVWDGECTGNSVRSSLWSRTIPYARNLYLWGHYFSPSSLHTYIYSVDLHRRTSYNDRSRPFNLTRSWNLHNLAYSHTLSIRNPSTVGSLLAGPEFVISNAIKFCCSSSFPHTCILGVNIQAEIWKWRGRIRHWFVILP